MKDGLTKYDRYRLKDLDAYRKRKAEWARSPGQREKRNAYMRIWREKNRERVNEIARRSRRKHRLKRNELQSERHLQTKYGISRAQKAAMVNEQGGLCRICGRPFKSARSTHVDHCHRTGRIRGILCNQCNTKLGWYEAHTDSIMRYLVQPEPSERQLMIPEERFLPFDPRVDVCA